MMLEYLKYISYLVVLISIIVFGAFIQSKVNIFPEREVKPTYHTDTLYKPIISPVVQKVPVPYPIYRDSIIYRTDTLYKASATDSMGNSVEWHSSMIIDSMGFFVTHIKPVIQYVERKEGFFDRLGLGLTVASGYGYFSKKPDIFIGIGVTYKLYP